MKDPLIDHLFRHHYGKMVSVLTRIFGLQHLETVEDAIQDTFVKAVHSWREKKPDNPEAWLTQAAKNRTLDIFRQLSAEKKRSALTYGPEAMMMAELFSEQEIEDSQLRMIFTSCHPDLQSVDQIAFALKTIAGFSTKEIAAALLVKEETIKRRLSRARKKIKEKNITFKIPDGLELIPRLSNVLEVLYLIFNEGFHSNKQDILIRKELCGEAMRLCKLLLKKKITRKNSCYALFALMCFHSARLDSKLDTDNKLIDLKNQDRTKWFFPLIKLGNDAMNKAVENDGFSIYHYEAAIACEHLKASHFDETNWDKILLWYEHLQALNPMPVNLINMAMVNLQLNNFNDALDLLNQIDEKEIEPRNYLLHGAYAEYHLAVGEIKDALNSLEKALETVQNTTEKNYLIKKQQAIIDLN